LTSLEVNEGVLNIVLKMIKSTIEEELSKTIKEQLNSIVNDQMNDAILDIWNYVDTFKPDPVFGIENHKNDIYTDFNI